MEYLLFAWPEVVRRVRNAEDILLLCDYDGTLTPIVERPELAVLPDTARILLQKLAHHQKFRVGIISGRAISDLKELVGINDIIYAGNHGLEIEGPGFKFINPLAEDLMPLLHLLHRVLVQSLTFIKGAFVEDKGLTLSVHYRQVDESRVPEVTNAVESIVSTSRAVGKVKTTTGKKVYEVRPAVDWDKGKAIQLLLDKYSRKKRRQLVIFLGDDRTDEDGFKVVNRYGGASIFIGEENTESSASYYLRSPGEVERFLELLLDPKVRLDNELG